MASENSSEAEFETLHGPVGPYFFEPTAKHGTEWKTSLYLYRSVTQKLVSRLCWVLTNLL